MRKKRFQTRSFISVLVAVSFLLLTVTGLVLYIVPSGRVAKWMQWNLLLMDKETWASIHTVLGFLFLVGGVFHLVFNWKPFRSYLADRWSAHLRPRRELLAACLVAALLTAGAITDTPPVSYIATLGSLAKDSWTPDSALRLPPGKPEELTLDELAGRIGIEPAKARSALAQAGMQTGDATASLSAIATANQVSPRTLFELLSRETAALVPGTEGSLGEAASSRGGGSGFGQRTVADVAAADGVDLETAIARLKDAGIEADGNARLRELAERADVSPGEIANTIRGAD